MNTRENRQTIVRQDLDEKIRKQAYYLWQMDGCCPGRDLEYWLEAKEMVRHRLEEPTNVRLHHRERIPVTSEQIVAVD